MGLTRKRWLGASVVIFTVAALFGVLGGTVADPDLWGHVRFGQLIRDLGFVPRYDPYAYTEAGRTWINHEWLAEWVFAWVYDLVGSWGLVLLKLAFVAAIFGLAADHLRRRGVGTVLGAILLLLAALPVQSALGTLRPHAFTTLLYLVVLLLLHASRRRPSVLWLLPPVFALWINLHGGVLAGLGVVAVWFAAEGVELWGARRSQRLESAESFLGVRAAVGAASIGALLLNPYGLELPRFLLETATVPRPYITEWAPLGLASGYGGVYLALLGVAAVLLHLSRRRLRTPEAALLALGALLPFFAFRHLALYGLVWVFALADPASDVWSRIRERRSGSAVTVSPRWWGIAVLALLMGGTGLAYHGARGLGCIDASGRETMEFPRETVRYLALTEGSYRLAVHFSWGEYAIWHLGPRVQVSMDGRRETVYPDSVYDAYLAFMTGSENWSGHLERPSADLALVTKSGPSANLLELAPGWTRVLEGDVDALYARDRVEASLPRVTPASGELSALEPSGDANRRWCFPR